MEIGINYSVIVLIIGIMIVMNMGIQYILKRLSIPSMIGFLIFGILIQTVNSRFNFLNKSILEIIIFMSKIGVVTLLFRVGLESDLKGLLGQLRRAGVVWTCDVVISGLLGFFASPYCIHTR